MDKVKGFSKPAPCDKPQTAEDWQKMFCWAVDALLCMEIRAENAEAKLLEYRTVNPLTAMRVKKAKSLLWVN